MRFEKQDRQVSLAEIQAVEAELDISFPDSLKRLFLENNGGVPIPYAFRTEEHNTIVNETLPLLSNRDGLTAVDSYMALVVGRNIVPRNLFPFAIDVGGDYFFVDCAPYHETVFYYKADNTFGENLNDLEMGLEQFWNSLEE